MKSHRAAHPPICWSAPTTWILLGIPTLALAGIVLWCLNLMTVPAGIWKWALVQYLVHMFLISAFYHRNLSHPTYLLRFRRQTQFVMSLLATTAMQGGPLWWAAIHRQHHAADTNPRVRDPHSDKLGFWWCHMGWLLAGDTTPNLDLVKDLSRYPGLRFVERFHFIPPILLGAVWCSAYGVAGAFAFFLVLAVVYQFTWFVNSAAHFFNFKEDKGCWLIIPASFGEWAHKYHHLNPIRLWQGGRWFQRAWDPAAWGVCGMWCLGLATRLRL